MDASERSAGVEERLQAGAIEAELQGLPDVDWSATWQSLKSGALSVVDTFIGSQRHYAVLLVGDRQLGEPVVRPCMDARRLEDWLGGIAQKNLSIDFGVSPSCVSSGLRRDIAELGISCAPSKVPLIIAILAAAAQSRGAVRGARAGCFVHDSKRYLVLGVPRPESLLFERLSPAEFASLRMLVEGKTYAEIGRERGVALRTVANQIASMFRRLNLSRKSGLQSLLVQLAIGAEPTSCTANMTSSASAYHRHVTRFSETRL